jgi:HAD superfamily hydrolase (TIGR01662 family)
MAITQRAVIFDKDGTLIENVPYNADPRLVRLAPCAGDALRFLHGAGYRIMVASNQSGLARGYFDENALAATWARIEALAHAEGVGLDGFFYCPHHPEGSVPGWSIECGCRKPAPGLLLRAAYTAGIPAQRCWMVGDILDDIEAGRRAGMRTVLIENGNETEWRRGPQRWPDLVVSNLSEAALAIVSEDGQEEGAIESGDMGAAIAGAKQ